MNVKAERDLLLAEIKRGKRDTGRFDLVGYLGTTSVVYNVLVPKRREIAKVLAKEHKNVSQDELIQLVDLLFRGISHEEKSLASLILGRYPIQLSALEARWLDAWMGRLSGWAEVDSFCDEIDVWLRVDVVNRLSLLKKWNKDKQMEKRRASLVVLCSSVRNDDSQIIRDVSFVFINQLKSEKHVMITKAISWLLRSLLTYHRQDVVAYLKKYHDDLPAIAVRETERKLETGKK